MGLQLTPEKIQSNMPQTGHVSYDYDTVIQVLFIIKSFFNLSQFTKIRNCITCYCILIVSIKLNENAFFLQQLAQYQPASQTMIAPVTGNQNMGLMRSEVKQGIRQIIACKDEKGIMGIRVQHINKGVFVSFVQQGSPASIAGMYSCDQMFSFLRRQRIIILRIVINRNSHVCIFDI